MGLFDYVSCEYSLPGSPPVGVETIHFQSKDLTCFMEHYRITPEGQLVHHPGESQQAEDLSRFTGMVYLYHNNVVRFGPGIYTANGEDAIFLKYAFTFIDGLVVSVQETENRSEHALKCPQPRFRPLTTEEREYLEERGSESLLGRTVYIWWGGQPTGYEAVVVVEDDKSWVVQSKAHRFEILDRHHRDTVVFDSQEDAKRYVDEWAAAREAKRQEYDRQIAVRFGPAGHQEIRPCPPEVSKHE